MRSKCSSVKGTGPKFGVKRPANRTLWKVDEGSGLEGTDQAIMDEQVKAWLTDNDLKMLPMRWVTMASLTSINKWKACKTVELLWKGPFD
jgi:hypothetical protein